MIIVLTGELFETEETDDVGLLTVFGQHRGRHKLRLRPAYRPVGQTPFHLWLGKQSARTQEQIRVILEQGLKEPEFVVPGGEPTVVVSLGRAEWPDSFARGPAKGA